MGTNDKKRVEFELQQVQQNIVHCNKNVLIFQAQVEKQQQQRIDLEILKRELEEKLKTL